MKALSLWPVWAGLIREGLKTLEIRSRPTHYRGPLLICSSQRPAYDSIPGGSAICMVEVVGCRPMTRDDEAAAGCPFREGLWAWELADVRPVRPFAVKGALSFYNVDDALIKPVRRPSRPLMPAGR